MSIFLCILPFIYTLIPVVLPCGLSNLTLNSLPGGGWDNLKGQAKDEVLSKTYSQCSTTSDFHYLLPDNFQSETVEESKIQLYSDMFFNWIDYTPVTYQSSNEKPKNRFGLPATVDGAFSEDFLQNKKKMLDYKAVALRVYLKVVNYSLKLGSKLVLDENLKILLAETNGHIINSNMDRARFILEGIVQKYGTHYVTRVDVGAILVEENYVEKSFVQKYPKHLVTAAASLEFLKMINFRTVDVMETVNATVVSEYKKARVFTEIKTIGGGSIENNMSVDHWVKGISGHMVSIDRQAEPLENLVSPSAMSNENVLTVHSLRNELKDVISRYYEYNEHKGCTFPDIPNVYNPWANVDDGSCYYSGTAKLNFPFGGFFQDCWTNSTALQNPCTGLKQYNPLTNGFSCPQPYTKVLLFDSSTTLTCDRNNCYSVEAHWCAYPYNVQTKDTLSYGGSFSKVVKNSVTGSFSCPHGFEETVLGYDMTICVAFESASLGIYSGGFFSCVEGNPQSFLNKSTTQTSSYSHNCPFFYTQNTLSFINGCYIKHCVTNDIYSDHVQYPLMGPVFTDPNVVFNLDKSDRSTIAPVASAISGVAIAAIVLGILLVIAILALVIVFLERRSRRPRNSDDAEPILEEENGANA